MAGAKAKREGIFARAYGALGPRLSAAMYAELVKRPSLRPRLTVARIAAYAIATAVHLVSVTLLIGAFVSVRDGGAVGLVLGVLLLALAWVLRPRSASPQGRVLERSEFPATHALVARVGDAVGAPPVAKLYADHDYNASATRTGLPRRTTIVLGVPLLVALGPQQRAALLGHELGHTVNGDSARSRFVGGAIETLGNCTTCSIRT